MAPQLLRAGLLALLCIARPGHAATVALSDEELAGVSGGEGFSVALHLELNTDLAAGFSVDGVKTYAVLQSLGGVADLLAISIDIRSGGANGADYLDIGLPSYVGFRNFGFRALGVQADPIAPVAPSASYGALQLNGTGTMTGHVYLWAQ